MRIAALAFGVVAGLIASLILALGGLDVQSTAQFASERQLQISRFGLFIIANIGVFGAGLVLASPLGGAVLFSIGALAWVLAALFLHHSTDLVLIVPPALLLVAGGLSLVSYVRRDRPIRVAPMKLGRRATADGPGDFEQVPQIRVGAGFFGEGGTAQPLRNAADPNLGSMNERDAPEPQWEPGRRRAVPPRQRQVFRQPEFDEPEEPGFARVARLISSVLSFGLYAAVAGAVILVAWNLHLGSGERPAAAKLEPAATASKPAPVIAPPASAPAASAPILAQSASAPAQQAPVGVIQAQRPPRQLPPGVIVAGGQQQPVVQPQPDQSALQPSGAQASAPPASQDASTDQASAADDSGAQPTDTPAVMPYPMPPQIAAGRGGATSKPAKTTPQTTLNSTGL